MVGDVTFFVPVPILPPWTVPERPEALFLCLRPCSATSLAPPHPLFTDAGGMRLRSCQGTVTSHPSRNGIGRPLSNHHENG